MKHESQAGATAAASIANTGEFGLTPLLSRSLAHIAESSGLMGPGFFFLGCLFVLFTVSDVNRSAYRPTCASKSEAVITSRGVKSRREIMIENYNAI